MSKNAKSIPWTRIGVEASAIIFSVLLALVLDDWRQSQDERAVVESVMLSLRAELERNQRVVEARLPYHEAMLDTFRLRMDGLLQDDARRGARARLLELVPLDRLGFDVGLGTEVSLANGAWEAARASGAMTRIGTDRLFLLSTAYMTQEQVRRPLERFTEQYDGYLQAVVADERSAAALIGFTRHCQTS